MRLGVKGEYGGPGNEAECGGLGMRLGMRLKGVYGGPGNEARGEG